jgi:hypothetical protein
MSVSSLGKCINPGCGAEFKRLGTGRIFTHPVKHPQAWGLPPNIKQKVVWLCGKCAQSHKVIFDHQRCQVLVLDHVRLHKRTA